MGRQPRRPESQAAGNIKRELTAGESAPRDNPGNAGGVVSKPVRRRSEHLKSCAFLSAIIPLSIALKGQDIKAQGWPRFWRPTLGGIVKGPNPEGVALSLNPFRVDRKCNTSPGLAAKSAANPGLCCAAASRLFLCHVLLNSSRLKCRNSSVRPEGRIHICNAESASRGLHCTLIKCRN